MLESKVYETDVTFMITKSYILVSLQIEELSMQTD